MSIQSELTRLTNAKAAIQTAIEGKGVTVPSGTLLDGMASLIEGIEAGGGSVDVITGTFTPASNPTYGYTVTHNLGKVPFFVLVNAGESITGGTQTRMVNTIGCDSAGYNMYTDIYNSTIRTSNSSNSITSSNGSIRNANETTFRIAPTNVLTTITYSWVAIG